MKKSKKIRKHKKKSPNKLFNFISIFVLAAVLIFTVYASSKTNIFKTQAAGNAWYVDNNAASSGNGSSWNSAWKNFSNISWGQVQPGDTIYISGGNNSQTYYETLAVGNSGTAQSPITITKGIESGHNGTVIIDGQNSRYYGVDIGYSKAAQNYVTVKNLLLQNFVDGAGMHARDVSNGVVFENNDIYTGSGDNSSPSRGIDIRRSNNLIVRNNNITTPSSTMAQTDGIWSSQNNGVIFDGNNIIISNTDNTGHSDGIQSYQDTNITIKNNYISQAGGSNNHGMWLSDTESGGTINIFNNVVYMPTNETYGISHWNDSYPSYSGKALIYNNTIYGANPGIQLNDSPNSEIKNNIISVSGSSNWGNIYLAGALPAAQAIDYNLLWPRNGAPVARINSTNYSWSQWQTSGRDVHGVYADPLFTNSGVQDFTLKSTSPAINKGVTLNIVTADKNGTTRPQGQSYDMGAYEFGINQITVAPTPTSATAPTPTPTQAQTPTNSPTPTNTPAPLPTATPTTSNAPHGLQAVYYNNSNFTGTTFSRIDSTINFNWRKGSPNSSIANDTFSAVWTGYVVPKYSQLYTFYLDVDDGGKLWIDQQKIIDRWYYNKRTESQGAISLNAGQAYPIRIEYYENKGGAKARLSWSSSSQAKQVVPQSQLISK